MSVLPVHPTTGLTALGLTRHGRPIWPVAGADDRETSGVYLERLRAEFDDITAGIESRLERAAAENRDLTDDENAAIEREDARRDQIQRAIDVQAKLLERTERVVTTLGGIRPVARGARTTTTQGADTYDVAREFPTAGHYLHTVIAAGRGDSDAIARLERATAHQVTGDNPGLIPRPIVGEVFDTITGWRRLVTFLGGAMGADAQKFDRPKITQHVAVGKQAAEKTLTESRVLKVTPVPVELETFAGHVNISKQNLRWTSPNILNLIFDDFAKQYGIETNQAACADLVAGVTEVVPIAAADLAAFDDALGEASQKILEGTDQYPQVMVFAPDAARAFAGLRTPLGQKAYNLSLVGPGGDVEGLEAVIDPQLPPGTALMGHRACVEFYEDLEGFLSAEEPGVLGQTVGYAGYFDTLLIEPAGWVSLTLPVTP